MSKVVSMQDAVREIVRDGDTVAIEGFTHLICDAAGHEIIRQRRRDLTLARMTPDMVYDQMIGVTLGSQPLRGDVQSELDALVDTLLSDCLLTTCDAERTETIVKGTCAAVLSSAAVTIH